MLGLYIHTLKYLRPSQFTNRLIHSIKRPAVNQSPEPRLSELQSVWHYPVKRSAGMLSEVEFCFLNETREVITAADWNNKSYPKLWLYNLHYFDDLNAIDSTERTLWHNKLISRWIKENPPGVGNGWEPYPISLRIVNWIKWFLAGHEPKKEWLKSLAIQIRYLSQSLETHLLGNHLFANVKAIFFAGCYFSGKEADAWRNLASHYLNREIKEQILPDGGHFELSPMYHAIILEDMLDLINIAQVYSDTVDFKLVDSWRGKAHEMLRWLMEMTHPDDYFALFNDAALNISANYKQLKSYAERLGMTVTDITQNNKRVNYTHLENSGYIHINYSECDTFLDVAKVGPDYLPGHAHADTLSFELSLFGQRVIVNGGTSCYGISEQRLKERETRNHSTVEIDGKNSSEVWSGFRVARRAYPKNLKIENNMAGLSITCAHDGYHRLPGKPTHQRNWMFGKNKLVVSDRITGKQYSAVARYIIHPNISCRVISDTEAQLTVGAVDKEIVVRIKSTVELILERAEYSPEFGKVEPTQALSLALVDGEANLTLEW